MIRSFRTIFSIIVLSLVLACSGSPKGESGVAGNSSNMNEPKYPDLKLIEDFFDFGSIVEGEAVSHTFHFRNAGNEVLIIKDLIPDCGCTQPKIDKREYNPGEEGSVEVIFNSKGWFGSQYKSVTLRTNSPNREKSVTIKANVLEPKE
jgi:hypothetical protein